MQSMMQQLSRGDGIYCQIMPSFQSSVVESSNSNRTENMHVGETAWGKVRVNIGRGEREGAA